MHTKRKQCEGMKKVFGVIFTPKQLIKMNHSLIVLNVLKAFSLSLNYVEKWQQERWRESNRMRKRMSWMLLNISAWTNHNQMDSIVHHKVWSVQSAPQKLNSEFCDFVLDRNWNSFALTSPINEKIELPNWIIQLIFDTAPEFRLDIVFPSFAHSLHHFLFETLQWICLRLFLSTSYNCIFHLSIESLTMGFQLNSLLLHTIIQHET